MNLTLEDFKDIFLKHLLFSQRRLGDGHAEARGRLYAQLDIFALQGRLHKVRHLEIP